MFRIARMFLSLGSAQLTEARHQIGRNAIHLILLAFFGLLFLIFGLAAATTALAQELGLLPALGIMAGGALVCLLITLLLMKLADRRHCARAAEQAELNRRLRQLAMLSAFGTAQPKTAHILGLGILAAGTLLILSRLTGGPRDHLRE